MPLRLFAKTLAFLMLFVAVGMGQTVSIQVETKRVEPGTEGFLRIYCNSYVPLSGLVIPLRIGTNNDIIIDSVSFQYTIVTGNFSLVSRVTDVNREGFINVIPDIVTPIPTFPAGWGEICRIYFRTTVFAADAFVPVDTFYNPTLYEWLDASDAYGQTLEPGFTPGGVEIRRATPVDGDNTQIPKQFSLRQNFPNPFNPSTQIIFSLEKSEQIRLDVYDVAGQRVTTLAEGRYSAGEHAVLWDAGSQPSGVYFYRLTTDSGIQTRKMLLIK
jgi:hypothetical protein